MSLTDQAPPTSPHLRPVHDEPPYDPDYDPPPVNGHHKTDHRTPPQDNAAEQSVLGAMLLAPSTAVDEVATYITPTDHYRPAHEQIHAAILTLHHRGDPVDPITVANELGPTALQHVGGAPYLHTLTANVPTAANATYYAKIVRDKARLRTAVDVGTKLTQLGYTGTLDKVDAYLGDALQAVEDAATRFTIGNAAATGLHDLSWVLTGEPPPATPPTWSRRTDGHALFYAGKVNGIFGDPECGKTWLAQTAIVEALAAGGTAAMIDVDHNGADHTAARLLLLGATQHQLADPARFRYYEPEDADELNAAITDLVRTTPDVAVIDSLGEALPMLGVSTNDGDEITAAMRHICQRPATAGACVITIDHLPKSHEARSTGYAIGSIAKKRMVRGAYIRAEARQQPAPDQIGRITLRIEKDTTGELRRSSGGGYAGTLVLDSTQPYTTRWSIVRQEMPTNDDGSFRPTNVMERVATFIADNEGCSSKDIETNVPGKAKWLREAVQILVTEGHVARTKGPRGAMLHTLLIPYREAEDDHA